MPPLGVLHQTTSQMGDKTIAQVIIEKPPLKLPLRDVHSRLG